jgi:hypothetical protein
MRPLPYRVYPKLPTTEQERVEWAIEAALRLAGDYAEPDFAEVARVKTGWTVEQWADRVNLLVDLSEECFEAELIGYGPRLHVADREYRLVLAEIAAGPGFDAHVGSALAVANSFDAALADVVPMRRTP